MTVELSIIIPAKNEAASLTDLLPAISRQYPSAEILVINDGSTDDTIDVCEKAGVQVITHPYTKGNGAAIKTGVRAASGEILVFMDGDGQHSPSEIPALLARLRSGYDLVIGSRSKTAQASVARGVANRIYNWLASYMTGRKVHDLTSGFRATRRHKFIQFLSLLPNGFSYPTTSTMAFFRAGYSVDFLPIEVHQRLGKSHIRVLHDGLRFFIVIFKIGTLYSPLKIFFPVSMFFLFSGLAYYLFTYISQGRFTNMSMLLFSSSVIIFLIGLISEQITNLMYKDEGQ